MSFCHEETAEAVDGRAMGVDGAAISPAEAAARQARPTASPEPDLFRRYFVDFADGCGVALSAGRFSLALHLLAATAAMGGGRRLAGGVARTESTSLRPTERTTSNGATKMDASCDVTFAAGLWSEPMHGLANSADCWFVMSIYSLPTAPSSISPASGSHSGDVFETRSSQFW